VEAAHHPWLRLGDLLVRDGLISAEQLRDALAERRETGQRIGEIVIDRGWISGRDLGQALAEQYDLEFLQLENVELDRDLAARLPENLAHDYGAIPVRKLEGGAVLIAVADPTNVMTSDDLKLAFGSKLRFVVADASEIEEAIRRVYRKHLDISEDMMPSVLEKYDDDSIEEVVEADHGDPSAKPAVKLVNSALAHAIEERASDIHFEPGERELVVRARIDGVMRELMRLPKSIQAGVTSRLKILAGLDIAERRLPQDGRFAIRFAGQPIDLRIAVMPTTHGEQVVLRVLHRASALTLAQLGMAGDNEASFTRSIHQPFGAVIVCGPTGSGKTTTLYAALNQLNSTERVLMTIEDPVEYQIEGVNQIEVFTRSGLTFARGLRTILRSDPDVLLVGEIRDDETARIAVQAAMTGHLVLTTLHAQDTASSIARLKDMGIEPALLAASLNCIVSQRLARRLCTQCKEPYDATQAELDEYDIEPSLSGTVTLYRPRGCATCTRTGYHGRVALYEVLPIRGKVRKMLERSTEQILAAALDDGMRTLRQDGARLALSGLTSIDEIRRVAGEKIV
jgi:type IV pilus assembly protein PilB